MSAENSREVAADQAAYNSYVASAINLTRGLQVSHLKWYWDMGALVTEFVGKQADNKLGTKNLETFAQDLKTNINGVEIGTSTLYCARSIHSHYQLDQLDDMVKRGVTVGHLKLLMPLKDEAKAQVAKKLYDQDGKAITIKQLDDLIGETARVAASTSVAKASEQAKPAREKPTPPAAPTADEMVAASAQADAATSTDTPVAVKPEDGKTGTRGATPQKEFSQPPLKALKAIDNVAIKLTASIADGIIVVSEAVKVGFDSDKAQKNYRDCFNSALASLQDALEAGQKLLELMKNPDNNI